VALSESLRLLLFAQTPELRTLHRLGDPIGCPFAVVHIARSQVGRQNDAAVSLYHDRSLEAPETLRVTLVPVAHLRACRLYDAVFRRPAPNRGAAPVFRILVNVLGQ